MVTFSNKGDALEHILVVNLSNPFEMRVFNITILSLFFFSLPPYGGQMKVRNTEKGKGLSTEHKQCQMWNIIFSGFHKSS